jgi:hypothetical protein
LALPAAWIRRCGPVGRGIQPGFDIRRPAFQASRVNVSLAYGQGQLPVEFPADRTTVISPSFRPGLADESAALRAAVDHPVEALPLRQWLRPGARICILFTDITRATPNDPIRIRICLMLSRPIIRHLRCIHLRLQPAVLFESFSAPGNFVVNSP